MAWSALLITFIMLTALLVSGEGPAAAAPSPSPECTTIVYDMIDCLSYIDAGSDKARPTAECCTGVKSVLRTDPDCLCAALNGAVELGIQLDVSRALGLPSACGQTTPPGLNNCGLSVPDAPSPSPASPVPVPDAPSPSPVADIPSPAPVSPPEQSPLSDSTSIPSPPPLDDVGDGDESPPSDSTSTPSPPPSDDDGDDNGDEGTSNAPAPSPSAAYITTSANAVILSSAVIFTILCF
ncbi:hypothetical protein Scep_018608 [Stephania cephalantha]|uniref:Bifunctional inhibitor/plant lipid transfer protein/seed storage helical domain-containing protein n=1 Tax=Stephania cephalantha TaxID=152367 RepID=A0AAP0I9D2_9MAGN